MEIGSGARRRLGSGFGGGDERISKDFEEDEQELWIFFIIFLLFGILFVKEPM